MILHITHTPAILMVMDFDSGDFIWDIRKEFENIRKHGVDFSTAARAFLDPDRKVYTDSKHSGAETRFFCIGRIEGRVVTVRFVRRQDKIRIFGAGYWRSGVKYYEKED